MFLFFLGVLLLVSDDSDEDEDSEVCTSACEILAGTNSPWVFFDSEHLGHHGPSAETVPRSLTPNLESV